MAHIHLQHDAAYYGEKAEALFEEGYNCSQAVLLAFAEECGLSTAVAARIASSFGGRYGQIA